MINDIDFVISPHATKRLERVVEIGFGKFDIQMVDESNTTQTFRVDYGTLPIGAIVDTDLPDPIKVIVSRAGKDNTHRIKMSFYYYYDETQPPPEDNIGTLRSFRYVTSSGVQYPIYVLWPNSVTQAPLTFDNTLIPSQIPSITTITDTAKENNVNKWKVRLRNVAQFFDQKDDGLKWAYQNANPNNIFTAPMINTVDANRLDNTSKHYPKGIGIAWRSVCAYEFMNYSPYGTPNMIRTDRYDPLTGIPINISNGDGLEELVKQIEIEYEFYEYSEENLLTNPIRKWYYTAGNATNLNIWTGNGYYGNNVWQFTSFQGDTQYQGAYSLYSAAEINDWNDLWNEYVNALNWLE